MSDFDQMCSPEDAVASYGPPNQPLTDAPPDEPVSVDAADDGGAGGAGGADGGAGAMGAYGHYAEDPVIDSGGAGGAPASDNDGAEGASAGVSEECVDPTMGMSDEHQRSIDPEEGGESVDVEARKRHANPREMTPEEKEADKQAKLAEYATQSLEEKQARWDQSTGTLSEKRWAAIQALPDAQKNQAMLQAGIETLDYDDPRRAQLEKIQAHMGGKNSRKGGYYEKGTPQTGCGSTVDQMLRQGGDPAGGFPGYVGSGTGVEPEYVPGDDELVAPRSGDVFELADPGNKRGHAGTFCVASPDGKTWLTYDGGQQSREASEQEVKLVRRQVSVNEKGETIVGSPDHISGSDADNKGRPVSATYDYQEMYDEYPALHPAPPKPPKQPAR